MRVSDYLLIRNMDDDLSVVVDSRYWLGKPVSWSLKERNLLIIFSDGAQLEASDFPAQSPWRDLYLASSAGHFERVPVYA